jgi:hypothetical protein
MALGKFVALLHGAKKQWLPRHLVGFQKPAAIAESTAKSLESIFGNGRLT